MDKIIFFDIDGTLYHPSIGIPESTMRSLDQLIKNGHKIVMCTGRSKGMIPESYFDMGFDGMIMGAGTYVEYDGTVLYRSLMSQEELDKVIDTGRREKIGTVLEGEIHGYYDPQNHDAYYMEVRQRTEKDCQTVLYSSDEAVDVPKWTYHHLEPSKIARVEESLNNRFRGIYHEYLNSVEFIPKDVNKAKGIEKILEYTNILKENAYAFGDSANDIDMIKYVKYGVAMGNAVPELLEAAPYHTARIDEDGIEKGLKRFGLIN